MEGHPNLSIINSIYGFGSFFKKNITYNDIDILIVTNAISSNTKNIKESISTLKTKNYPIDLYIFTLEEFQENLLREQNDFEKIFFESIWFV